LYLKDLFDFFEMKPSIASAKNAPHAKHYPRRFCVRGCRFRYPESERWAVRHVNFACAQASALPSSAKTARAKLRSRNFSRAFTIRLKDESCSTGWICASTTGVCAARHRRYFQDFVRYDFRFDENIGVGEIDKVSALNAPENGNGNGQTRD
jgi:ATP-binding cassette subfamily B protein